MAEFQPLGKGIYCIDSGYIQKQYAAIYLIQESDEIAIVDTGTFHSIPNVLATLTELDIAPEQVKYVIPTHIHLDHAGGASSMLEVFTQARLIIHPRGARHMIDPSRLIAGSISVYGEAVFHRLYGEIKPISEDRVDIANDSDIYSLADRKLLFINTPGHAKHHFCIYDEISNGFFTGDTFGLSYPAIKHLKNGLIPTSSPVDFDPDALLNSVDRMLEYLPERMYLTHFGEIDKPDDKINGFKDWVSDYISLCERLNPVDETSTRSLEQALRQLTLDKLASQTLDNGEAILRLLSSDIRLNATGLSIWWKSLGHA